MFIDSLAKKISEYRSAIMGLAALIIFFYHDHARFMMGIPGLGFFEDLMKQNAFFGVEIFMILSGFSVVFSLSKNSVGKFYVNRLIRIYPVSIVMGIAIMLIYNLTFVDFLKRVSGYEFFAGNINNFPWFIFAILTFYLVSPIFYHLFKKAKNRNIAISEYVLIYILIVNFIDRNIPVDVWSKYIMLHRFVPFLIGMYLGFSMLESRKVSEDKSKEGSTDIFEKGIAFLFVLVFILGAFIQNETCAGGKWFLVPNSIFLVGTNLIAISIIVLTICLLEKAPSPIATALKRFFEFFGAISLEFYLVNEVVGERMLHLLSIEGRFNSIIYNVVCLIVSVIAAKILQLITKPLKRININK